MTKLRSVVIIVWLVITATLAQPGLGTTHSSDREGSVSENAEPPNRMKLTQLEHRLVEIDDELSKLAIFSLNTGVGSVGYRSLPQEDSASEEWIQIDLGQETPIDQIVLVPAIWRDTIDDFTADGFPLEFSIVAGTGADPDGMVIASYSVKDHLLPRIAPVVVPCEGTVASWVRLEVSQLSPRDWDGKYILQLSEILVFSGGENVALRRPVQAASTTDYKYGARQKRYLVDGFVPYLMNARKGESSIAFVSHVGIGDKPTLTIDLQSSQPLSGIQLHATEVSDTVPQTIESDFGIPRRMLVEGANQHDFSDAVPLVEYSRETIFDAGPIMARRFPATPCRYVRMVATEPYLFSEGTFSGSRIGFAEIELFAKGKNVALGKQFQANFDAAKYGRSLTAITDGRNLYGQILPLRDWLNELSRRHDLEAERPLVRAELDFRYQRQKANLNRLIWLAVLLATGIVLTLLINRSIRMRQLTRLKMRFAADIHDELGANLHTIGLLSDLAEQATDQPDELSMLHKRIRVVTQQTGTAVRHCTDMLEADGLYKDLITDMRRAAERVLAKLDHDFSVDGKDHLNRLGPRTRADLFLFYKECLVNISRHSGATQFATRLVVNEKSVRLTISDNGSGLGDFSENQIPSSLQRRAQLLNGKVTIEPSPEGGTCIQLKLRRRSWRHRK